MVFRIFFVASLIVSLAQSAADGKEISRIWLSYSATSARNIVMNWYSPELGNAQVELMYGDGGKLVLQKEETARIHHVNVPLRAAGGAFRYRVKTNDVASAWYTVRGISAQEPVRIAVVADWGFAAGADMTVILKEKPDHRQSQECAGRLKKIC